ncbi:MAG: GNAT family N-acetyltransferase [Phycisphaeraceae bacterium]
MNDACDASIPELRTARLLLRGFTVADAGALRRLEGDRAVAETTLNIPHPYEEGVGEAWIGTHAKDFAEDRAAVFAVTPVAGDELVGAVGLTINREHRHAELGYWIGHPYWGRGYATEATAELLRFGFTTLGLHRIFAHYFATNSASGRVMQKLGMQQEGMLREHALKWEKFVDLICCGILEPSWRREQGG